MIDRLVAGDVPAIVAYRNDPKVAEFQAWPLPFPEEDAGTLVGYTPGAGEDLVAGGQLAIRLAAGRALVGDLMVQELRETPHAFELGVTVATPWQRMGYAGEALLAVIEALFDDRRVHRLVAYVQTANDPSLRLFDRLGFHREDVLSGSIRSRAGELVDEVVFGLTRAE